MSAWTPQQAARYKVAFYEFLRHVDIKSKEHETWITLGENLYDGQVRVIEAIFDGLGKDIHDFKVLKSRQLGISTIIRALMLFWTGVFSLTGALVFDSAQHLEEGRQELLDMLERLPSTFRFPRKHKDNRYNLILENKSRVNLFSAGTREQKGTKALGAGSAISMWHRSELCNYGNIAGLEHLRHSRARVNPNRLFIDESTALGFNIWYEIWQEARLDHHTVCIFVGWWSHPEQRIEKNDPDFEVYGIAPLTEYEKNRIQEVYRLYGHKITAEQVAWIRRENNPVAQQQGDADADYSPTVERLQNQPWTEDDCFQLTGSVFFDPSKLLEQINKNVIDKYDTYSFLPGPEFVDFKAMKSYNAKSIELKIWEEPVEEAVYVVSADVAFGASENNDRSAIQVLRCFSDGVDQVAEYAWPLINTRQFAWVIAAVEGWYAGDKSDVYRIIELNGPGEATFNELRGLKFQLDKGYFGNQVDERGLRNIQKNVKNYLYQRTDSMQASRTYHWKTTSQLKVAVMERLRDFTSNGMLRIRSRETLEEMRTISRDGDKIEASGTAKDDRVISLALGIRMWDERVRRLLIAAKRSRNADEIRRRVSVRDQISLYNQSQFDAFMVGRNAQRSALRRVAMRQAWRGR